MLIITLAQLHWHSGSRGYELDLENLQKYCKNEYLLISPKKVTQKIHYAIWVCCIKRILHVSEVFGGEKITYLCKSQIPINHSLITTSRNEMQRTYDLKLGTAAPLIRSVFSCGTLKILWGLMEKQILLYNNLIVWFQKAPIFDVVQKTQ